LYCCHHTSFHLFCQQFFKQHIYQRQELTQMQANEIKVRISRMKRRVNFVKAFLMWAKIQL
jgi:hypothetical protein